MRFIGLDVGRDFVHVAVGGGCPARRLARIAMGDDFRAFAIVSPLGALQ